jgi:NAD(P)-dependent dehydrogenase (short-subunit alcohol dehydrogenase family)
VIGRPTQKTAIVTGSTRGIGLAIALRLAASGHNVVLNHHRDDESADEALRLCAALTPHVRLVKADVGRPAGAEMLVDEACTAFGAIDILVNNAGLNVDRPMLEMSEEDWDRVVDTNMKGVFLCAQRAARHMVRQSGGGVILNIGASTGIRARRDGLNYCAAKAGVLVMTKCMAMELAPRVRVNCLIPGMTRTGEMVERFHLDDADALARVEAEIPLGRVASPEEIADVACFLLSAQAEYINGQKIIADGGQFMY